uniref:Uncharacterized protein n=1 Tax=Plectus sambesii TaxID=2011161 RepID=A0A914VUV7_9BILA
MLRLPLCCCLVAILIAIIVHPATSHPLIDDERAGHKEQRAMPSEQLKNGPSYMFYKKRPVQFPMLKSFQRVQSHYYD